MSITKMRKITEEELLKEHKHLIRTDIPRCIYCKKNFIHDIDSITKKVSKYLWKSDCDCIKHKIKLSMG